LTTSVVARPLTGKVIKEFVIPNTVSQPWYLGHAVHMARKSKADFINVIVCHLSEVSPFADVDSLTSCLGDFSSQAKL
jgi:DUF917 family protein